MTWLEEFRCDGLRFDATAYIRSVNGEPHDPGTTLADGWSFLAWINDEIRARQPWKLTIAEDIKDDPAMVAPTADGGAGFGAQWDVGFIRRLRPAITAVDDEARDLGAVAAAITGEGRGPAPSRVIYTESHDDVANDQVRVPEAISPGDAASWWAKKRATLGSALVLTSPGIPMLFQGQELLEDRWFDDTVALDWSKAGTHEGILRLHRDLIALRRGVDGRPRGLRGPHVALIRANGGERLLAMHRWQDGGPGDDVLVLANFGHEPVADLPVGMPRGGRWRVWLNSDSNVYAPDFAGHEAFDVEADGGPLDGLPHSGRISVGPYSVVVLSQDA
jgi:1,4-alpha-glucan branching enzyme